MIEFSLLNTFQHRINEMEENIKRLDYNHCKAFNALCQNSLDLKDKLSELDDYINKRIKYFIERKFEDSKKVEDEENFHINIKVVEKKNFLGVTYKVINISKYNVIDFEILLDDKSDVYFGYPETSIHLCKEDSEKFMNFLKE